MKISNCVVITAGLLFSCFASPSVANAATGYGYASTATHKVKTTKPMKVYKVLVGKDEAHNQFFKAGKIKRGTHLSVSDWVMSTGGGYVVTGQYHLKPTSKTFYFVFDQNQKKWFK
ncbi:hypothetical protein MOO44_07550 [Nicoliella spurrieriana]|uniref:Uncharacterized protein n=1 Tax=Nicoliella spurrieriana TaxID=2925830 RepID=A0A976X5J2_9LACO|nr:hypothetical protein [Nicoliella spurrieriana]UQS86729.1 hypothetical protein MOO44_07550 [Nicoliella spurrieriana]